MSFAIRLILLSLMAITGIVLALAEAEWPAKFWDTRDAWVDRSRVTLTVAALVEPIRALVVSRLRDRDRRRSELVEGVLYFMLEQLDSETAKSLRWHDIGVHVWEVRHRWAPEQFQHLRKVARVRIVRD